MRVEPLVANVEARAVKDKSYQSSPLGTLVGRYIRWFRNEWGATPATIRDYEAILARMSLTLADRSRHRGLGRRPARWSSTCGR
jgi:hypothetical protein